MNLSMLTEKNKKAIYIAGGFTTVIIFLAIIFNVLVKPRPRQDVSTASAPIPTPTLAQTLPLSLYATDSAILTIEENIKRREFNLLNTDLKEASLNPPSLDMDVKF